MYELAPDIDRHIIDNHHSRISERYFETFTHDAVALHLAHIAQLDSGCPVRVILEKTGTEDVTCTVIAFDYPYALSLITGILGSLGLSIHSGTAFTYAKSRVHAPREMHRRRYLRKKISETTLQRKKIIDRFTGTLNTTAPFDAWKNTCINMLEEVFGMLEKRDADSVDRAKMTVTEGMVKSLQEMAIDQDKVLYPIKIDIDNESGPHTRMQIVSEDIPFFLYTLSTALSLHGIVIEEVNINTAGDRVFDEFYLVDTSGEKIIDENKLRGIRLSVLLTKQFTYFLGNAPDPFTALARFEEIVEESAKSPQKEPLIDLLASPTTMQGLAQLFGASTFLWEDFIRLQYEELLPLISAHTGRTDFIKPIETLYWRLEEYVRAGVTLEEKIERINRFKDSEIFQIDLNHIINHPKEFKILSEQLTILAEIIVNYTTRLLYEDLCATHGTPRTVAGLEARYAVMGLGKIGGAALGYASDIELLFIYSDSGQTDGASPLSNAEFFNLLVKKIIGAVRTKREGIFNLDLRLRPYGSDGPLASSLNTFCQYYGKGGKAHAYERLALVRLRAIGGDTEFGLQIERLRDEMIYASQSIDLPELHDLREKQLLEMSEPGRINAKFSPGALVDLEYTVQLLQVRHGANTIGMRTPRIHTALHELTKAGVLFREESDRLIDAYGFLRHLINGLRMLRGSAKDLFLPPGDSVEFVHLARRLGYTRHQDLEPQKRLELDFNTHTAVVRSFIERHFGRDSIPGPAIGNVADLILSETVPDNLAEKILSGCGFVQPGRAYRNLKLLAGSDKRPALFARLTLLACDVLKTGPDPDMALNNWERFVQSLDEPYSHYTLMLKQPKRLEIVLGIFAASQFLSEILIKNPEFLDWVTQPENIDRLLKRETAEHELSTPCNGAADHAARLDHVRRYKKREILRIGTRDICLQVSLQDIVSELSALAEACIRINLEQTTTDYVQEKKQSVSQCCIMDSFCIMAFGKLGGSELNYSSDIDLLGLYDDAPTACIAGESPEEIYSQIMTNIRENLSQHTAEGYAYRVDLRLRPYGSSGPIVYGLNRLVDYYSNDASLWEIQALLKLRPVAGNTSIGDRLIARLKPLLLGDIDPAELVSSITSMRNSVFKQLNKKNTPAENDIKDGPGGIRDIEFLAQGLQLLHARRHPDLIDGNTLSALARLEQHGVLPQKTVKQLTDDYLFLRKTEHVLQIFEDRQVHALPSDRPGLHALAKRIHGNDVDADFFIQAVKKCRARVQETRQTYLLNA